MARSHCHRWVRIVKIRLLTMIFKKNLCYLYLALCSFLILIHLFGPYGGISFIWHYIKRGYYDLENVSFSTSLDKLIIYLNQGVSILFWLCVIVPLFVIILRITNEIKQNIIFLCMFVFSIIVFIPKLFSVILWHFFQRIWGKD